MMGSPNQPLNPNITGVESTDIASLVQSSLDQYFQQNPAVAGTQQGGAPSEYKVNVFGQEQTFKSPEEAGKAIEQALLQVRDAAFQQAQAAANQGQAVKAPETTSQVNFDQKRFADLVAEDTLKGLDYALGHMLFDGKVDNASRILREQLNDMAQTKQVMAAYQFREAYPTFPGDARSIQTLDAVRQELGLRPDNAKSWEAAYSTAIARGVLPPPAAAFQQPQQVTQQQQPQHSAPPMLGTGTSEAPPSWVAQAEQLPVDQLEALYNKLRSGG